MRNGKRKPSLSFVLILLIVFMILPTNFYMLYSAGQSQEIIVENAVADLEHIASIYMSGLNGQRQNINNFVNRVEENDVFLSRICGAKDWDTYYIAGMGLRNVMEEHMALYRDGDIYFYYADSMQHGMLVDNEKDVEKERLKEVLFAGQGKGTGQKWQMIVVDDAQWLVHVNSRKDVFLGAGIRLDDIVAAIEGNMDKPVQVFLDDQGAAGELPGVITVTRQCGRQNLYLHIQVERKDIISSLSLLQQLGYYFAFVDLLLIPLVLLLLRHFALGPLEVLDDAINCLKKDTSYRIRQKANTQNFDKLYGSFNKMADEIVALRIDNYEHRLKRRRIELMNLRLQIKPHFLFNSLNLMYTLVQINEYKSVQIMLLYLSDYFRYINVGDRDFSLFHEEYLLIQKYLETARIRYPDTFTVEYDIEDEALEAMVPQLLVHNFVENTVKHGLDLRKKNQILLKARLEGENLVVCVEDNGVGMPREQAESISRGSFEYADGKKHLGMENSYRRIQYYYGEKGSIRIISEPGSGTKIILRFPAQVTEEPYES